MLISGVGSARLFTRIGGDLGDPLVQLWFVDPELEECEQLVTFTQYKTTNYFYLDIAFDKLGKYLLEVRVDGEYAMSDTLLVANDVTPGIIQRV